MLQVVFSNSINERIINKNKSILDKVGSVLKIKSIKFIDSCTIINIGDKK